MKKKYLIYILLIFIGLTFIIKQDKFLFSKKNIDFWEENNCIRGVPINSFNSGMVNDYESELDRKKGTLLETFSIEGRKYSLGNFGCSSFNLKLLLPINDKNVDQETVYQDALISLDSILEISTNPFFQDIKIVLEKEINSNSMRKYIHRIYEEGCLPGECSWYVVISPPTTFQEEDVLPVSFTFDL